MKKHEYLWTTKNGDVVWVDEMTDSHLINTYRMLSRMRAKLQGEINLAYSFSFQGEMAQYYQDQCIDESERGLDWINAWQEVFKEEIQKRKLKI